MFAFKRIIIIKRNKTKTDRTMLDLFTFFYFLQRVIRDRSTCTLFMDIGFDRQAKQP